MGGGQAVPAARTEEETVHVNSANQARLSYMLAWAPSGTCSGGSDFAWFPPHFVDIVALCMARGTRSHTGVAGRGGAPPSASLWTLFYGQRQRFPNLVVP